ncbi:hypothetical protein CROQUDRAFT_110351, partial [Cronartium quercuum f. sp. fusiforme G11]
MSTTEQPLANATASELNELTDELIAKQQANNPTENTIFNFQENLGSVINNRLIPNAVPPSVISVPALPPESQVSEDTNPTNRFLADNINLQSNFNNYLPTNNIQQNLTKNQGPLPNSKEVREIHQLPQVDRQGENSPLVDNVTQHGPQGPFQVGPEYQNMVIDLESVTEAQHRAPSVYTASYRNKANHPVLSNPIPLPADTIAQLELLRAYFEDWKVARVTNNPLKWALAVRGAQGVRDDLRRKLKGRILHDELRKRLWLDTEVWNPWHYE